MIAQAHEPFYAELISRNRGLISDLEQARLRSTRFVIAGCGSTGDSQQITSKFSGLRYGVRSKPNGAKYP